MFRLEWLFLMQIGMGILMVILLRKLTQLKKQVDDITKEVKEYIAFIIEDTEGDDEENLLITKKNGDMKKEGRNTAKKRTRDEEESDLIQAVLGEYFP